jgi:hypothetical protein
MKNKLQFVLMRIRQLFMLFGIVFIYETTLYSQTTPPTIIVTTPSGIQLGTIGIFVIEGTDLSGSSELVFSEPGLSGKILEVAPVPSSQAALEIKVVRAVRSYFEEPAKELAKVQISAESWMAPGTHQFRLITPHGSSTPGKIVVSPFPETQEQEPNDTLQESQLLKFPVTVHGTLSSPGDNDAFQFSAKRDEEVVCLISAASLGSRLDPVMEVFDVNGKRLMTNLDSSDRSVLGLKIPADGSFVVRISDFQKGGSIRHFYRLTLGEFPYLVGRYPLGLRAGTIGHFQVWGFNLAGTKLSSPEPFGMMTGKVMETGQFSAKTPKGETLNTLPVSIGRFEEVSEAADHNSLKTAQELKVPVTVNGRISLDKSGNPLADFYRFTARKGQQLILETAANRLGSPMDSVIEVLDANGKIVPRVTARAVYKTQLILRDRNSKEPNIRLFQPSGIDLNNYMVVGNELIRVTRLLSAPGADEEMGFDNFGGQRLTFEDTTPEAHALDDAAYKVELYPPGTQFPPNGMPVFRFNMRNDDGGPGYGKDSHLTFTAPDDGTYFAKVTDVQGHGGEDCAYRFTIRDPVPDFLILSSPTNPNIPEGSQTAVEVSVLRTEGFDGPIDVSFDGLPAGIEGTRGTLKPDERSITLILSHKPGTSLPDGWSRFRVVGKARIGKEPLERVANPGDYLKVIALMKSPDIKVTVKTPQIKLAAGGETKVTLAVERQNGFKGRVQFRMNDLPFGVRVTNVGLNGIMIPENKTEITFTLDSRPWVKPLKKLVFPIGIVEALVPTEHPATPISLEIVGNEQALMTDK